MNNLHDTTTEAAILGACLMHGSKAFLEASRGIRTSKTFYKAQHRCLWLGLQSLADAGTLPVGTGDGNTPAEVAALLGTVDASKLGNYSGSVLDYCGGFVGLTELGSAYASVSQLHGMSRHLHNLWGRRVFAAELEKSRGESITPESDPESIIDGLRKAWEATAPPTGKRTLRDAIEAHMADTNTVSAGCWGIAACDRSTPLMTGRQYVLAAPPGGGKSVLGLQVAIESACSGFPVGFLSLEMTLDDIGERAQAYGCPDAALDMVEIRDKERPTYADLPRLIERMANDGMRLVVVDHMHRVRPASSREDGFTVVSRTSNEIADAARRNNVAVLTLAQMNRQGRRQERQKDGTLEAPKEYQMADLRGSGEIEDNANVILFINETGKREGDQQDIMISCAKNRHGATGWKTPLVWTLPKFRMQSEARRQQLAQQHPLKDQAPSDGEDLFGA